MKYNYIFFPENAKLLTRTYMGAPPHELSVKMYSFEKDSNEAFATVTEECTPIEDHFSNGNRKPYVIFHQQSLYSVPLTSTAKHYKTSISLFIESKKCYF